MGAYRREYLGWAATMCAPSYRRTTEVSRMKNRPCQRQLPNNSVQRVTPSCVSPREPPVLYDIAIFDMAIQYISAAQPSK